jgi:hypothetical protein
MSTVSYSLAEVAEAHLPREWKDAERWLSRRLNRRELRGVRFGRVWRMREADIDYMLSRYSNEDAVTEPVSATRTSGPVSVADGLSARSRRRLQRSA